MCDLAETQNKQMLELLDSDLSDLDGLEEKLLAMAQAEIPVAHHFGPGIYIREAQMPAGSIVLGHYHKTEHMNIMLTGEAVLLGENGQFSHVRAPMIFTGKPGRKLAYVLQPMTWLNIYSTNERDIDKLEEMFMNKSPAYCAFQSSLHEQQQIECKEDRDDFCSAVDALGLTEEKVRELLVETEDMCDWSSSTLRVYDSPIQGQGVFTSANITSGSIIGPSRISGKRTILGRYVNHAKVPNCRFQTSHDGDVFLIAITDIKGCEGGGKGTELTVNYRETARLIEEARALCLE